MLGLRFAGTHGADVDSVVDAQQSNKTPTSSAHALRSMCLSNFVILASTTPRFLINRLDKT